MEFILRHNALLKNNRDSFFRTYHLLYERNMIQYLPECARYDAELGYTLKPGICRFTNREFDVECRINSIGVRDDEASLSSPEIIVVGDSHAMGWGSNKKKPLLNLWKSRQGCAC